MHGLRQRIRRALCVLQRQLRITASQKQQRAIAQQCDVIRQHCEFGIKFSNLFGVFFKQKLAGKPFTVVGDGTQRRDFVYASDVAQAFRLAAETDKSGEIWNLGAGAPQSVSRLVELIGGPVVYIPKRPGEPDVTWADVAKIRRDLDWKPLIPFEEGVRLMMAEIQNWRDAPLWDPESIKKATKTWFEALGTE